MQSICVFCASSLGRDRAFADAARALAGALVRRGLTLVYGGGNVGLMGVVADEALRLGGRVIGVMPQMLVDKEIAHHRSELRIVGSMHERKALMAELSDGFIALPGGFGTLEEFCEILTWSQLGLHHKPFGILNTSGFYDHFLAFLDHAVEEQLLKPKNRSLVLQATEPEELLAKMEAWRPDPTPKWIRNVEQT